jgi:NAD(P)-dependent dehydrogenase (short-subunit alcohol dehydrogenase family)
MDGKVAIVTGASRGIGESIVRAYAAHGASVVLAARKVEGLESVAADIRALGGKAIAVACHAGKEDQIAMLVERSVSEFGKVDVLVNNAATNPYFGPLLSTDWGAWDKTCEVNVKGYFMAIRELVKHLQSRSSGGTIVNVASIGGMFASPAQGVYGMTKAAVISMTKTLAVELGPLNIRVNAIAPGLIETKFASALTSNPQLVDRLAGASPAHRVGQPDDLAGIALLLGSDAGNFITGQSFVIDGGQTQAIGF